MKKTEAVGQKPFHHILVVCNKRTVPVTTDFPLTEANALQYAGEIKSHIHSVEHGEIPLKYRNDTGSYRNIGGVR